MSDSGSESGGWTAQTHKNTVRLGLWTGGWVVSLAIATFGSLLVWNDNAWLTGLSIAANLVVGVGMILANKHHLQGLDELQQKIQLEAMALALGVALVAGLAYSTADSTNLIAKDAEISYLVILVSFTYMAGIFFGNRKYR